MCSGTSYKTSLPDEGDSSTLLAAGQRGAATASGARRIGAARTMQTQTRGQPEEPGHSTVQDTRKRCAAVSSDNEPRRPRGEETTQTASRRQRRQQGVYYLSVTPSRGRGATSRGSQPVLQLLPQRRRRSPRSRRSRGRSCWCWRTHRPRHWE